MPHVIVKLLEGRSETQKAAIAEQITRAVVASAGCPDSAVSVHLQDVAADRWTADVYTPDITPHMDALHKKPGYTPT